MIDDYLHTVSKSLKLYRNIFTKTRKFSIVNFASLYAMIEDNLVQVDLNLYYSF